MIGGRRALQGEEDQASLCFLSEGSLPNKEQFKTRGFAGGSPVLKKNTGSLTLCNQMSPFSEGRPVCLPCVPVSVHVCVRVCVLWGVWLRATEGEGLWQRSRRISRIRAPPPSCTGMRAHTCARLALFFPSPTMITCR